ncbi:alpha/beta hydrolase fold domain-containing protein [Yinghuangia seranimata]|uniref:alpha/beta hydrolase fold domain-containing protein n=1 Tax=Yinghuangia seranimata TaxID=408067 RepID=UPI00248C87CE|nr:alpha/beta hydrolase fold domain-containing protein [Yinghuangia seranimata]MDI2124668.1 alpha/beta hydrolase fold domain-containing protein [Yinghuangia seranimata]
MPLAPEIAALVDVLRDAPPELTGGPDTTVEEGRALHEAGAELVTPPEERGTVASAEDRTVPGPAGPVDVRVYLPVREEPGPVPTLLWMHGGGWASGSVNTGDTAARALCELARVAVVSVGYRLAPEAPWPAGLDDCTATLRWVRDNIRELGGDPARIGVGGDSAGGNLAAVLAQRTPEHGVPLAAQLLVYPATDLRLDADGYPSRERYATGYMFETAELHRAVARYLGPDGDPTDPRVSPLLAEDLGSVPPALVVTVEYDPLRDEGAAYAAKLAAAGIPVVHQDVPGLVHGSFDMLGLSGTARTAMADAAHALADLFAADHSRSASIGDDELRGLVARLSLEDKVRLIVGEDFWSLPELPQIGLRKLRMSDGPVGVRGTELDSGDTSLLLPSPTAQAATWDPEVARRVGVLMGAQARDKDIQVLLAPTVNMHRSPLGGRHFECYSEDPLLTSKIGVGFVEGVQSAGVAATMKHYVANDSENERMTYDSRVGERALREVYLAPFEAAVREARVWLVMSAYNATNGHSMTENSRLQNDVLKAEWGFDGVVVSDWMAVRSNEPAYLGGTDVAMPGFGAVWSEHLLEALREGRVDPAVLDDKVLRVLRLAARVGVLGDTAPPEGVTTPADADAQIRAIAARAMVLLENRGGTLPVDKAAIARVALIGPNAVRLSAQGGGSAHVTPPHVVGVPEGLRAALGADVEITVREGVFTHRRLPPLPSATAVDPATGRPGVGLEFRGVDGSVLDTGQRCDSYAVFIPGAMPPGTASIVMRTRITPTTDGAHLLDVLGAGHLELTVGSRSESFDLVVPSGDIAEMMMHPPLQRVEVDAEAGVPVDLELVYGAGEELFFAAFGLGWSEPRLSDDEELAEAVADAAAADVAIVVVGTTDDIESEGFDRRNLALPGRSDDLVRQVAAANPNTIVVVNAGAPVLMPWRDEVAALVWAWLPGQEGGDAVADVLTGAQEPGGRLPTTFPAAESDVPVLSTTPVDGGHDYGEGHIIGYRLWAAHGNTPAYPFGFGQGYTDWDYRTLRVDGDADRGLSVEVGLANTGPRHGREVVQVYLEPDTGELFGAPEPIRLIGFAAVEADAGAEVVARVTVDPATLARWDEAAGAWTTVPGTYRVSARRGVADPRLHTEISLAPSRPRTRDEAGR